MGFEFADIRIRCGKFLVEVPQQFFLLFGVGFALGEIDVRFDIAGESFEFLIGGELVFYLLAVAKDALRFFLIAPEVGVGGADFEGLQARAVLGSVKESSAQE